MPHAIGLLDRLRIERLVWALDQRTYDLPRRTRIDARREIRANLLEAAADVGTTTALRNVGDSSQLAEQYLRAEFGDRPRASWTGAAVVAALFPLLMTAYLSETQNAFLDGITAADPQATGTYLWHGVSGLQTAVHATFTNGQSSSTGGAWAPLAYAIWLVVTVAAGRLWRLRRSRSIGNPRVPASAA